MNCKKDDLAIIIRSAAGHEGKIVTCLEYMGKKQGIGPGQKVVEYDIWRIDRALPSWNGVTTDLFPDEFLKPLRDPGDDAVDEMLKITQLDELGV